MAQTQEASTHVLDLISQYAILSSIATELSVEDILNFGLASKNTWSCISSAVEQQKLAISVSQKALRCAGLSIKITPLVHPENDDVYVQPCHKKSSSAIHRCQGCGVGVCETCRFRVTHGQVVILPKKQPWFFPTSSRSGAHVINDNIEHLVASFVKHGHGDCKPLKNPCPCTYEDRWLNRWLCVPCLNKDLLQPTQVVPSA